MLYDIKKNCWSKELLKIFNIPRKILPTVKDSADDFGYTTFFGDKTYLKASLSFSDDFDGSEPCKT